MGFKFKRAFKGAAKIAKAPVKAFKKLTGSGSSKGGDDLDARSSAASKQIVNTKKQAGGSQIEYQTEV